jgi:hypothetical protein
MDLGFWKGQRPLQNIIITICTISTFHMARALLTEAVFFLDFLYTTLALPLLAQTNYQAPTNIIPTKKNMPTC